MNEVMSRRQISPDIFRFHSIPTYFGTIEFTPTKYVDRRLIVDWEFIPHLTTQKRYLGSILKPIKIADLYGLEIGDLSDLKDNRFSYYRNENRFINFIDFSSSILFDSPITWFIDNYSTTTAIFLGIDMEPENAPDKLFRNAEFLIGASKILIPVALPDKIVL
jgi:hypothetical protein